LLAQGSGLCWQTSLLQCALLVCQLSSAAIIPRPQNPSGGLRHLTQRLPVFDVKLHDKGALIALPDIAAHAAYEPFIVMFYFNERSAAAFAATEHGSSISISLAFVAH
jgi:hypothetical protein